MNFGNLRTIEVLRKQNGIIDSADDLVASGLESVIEIAGELGTEAKAAAGGMLIKNVSGTISGLFNLAGMTVDTTTIESVGEAMIIGAGISVANKAIDNYTDKLKAKTDEGVIDGE